MMTYGQLGFLCIGAFLSMCTLGWLVVFAGSRDERRRMRSATIIATLFAPFEIAALYTGMLSRASALVEWPEDYISGFIVGGLFLFGLFGTVDRATKIIRQWRAGRA